MNSGEDIYQQGERKFDPPQNSTQEILILAQNYTNTDMTSSSILKMTSLKFGQGTYLPPPLKRASVLLFWRTKLYSCLSIDENCIKLVEQGAHKYLLQLLARTSNSEVTGMEY